VSAFGFDPEQLFGRRGRPRVVRTGGGSHRRRWIALGVITLIVILVIVGRWLLGLRTDYLFFKSLDHTNVFWTPFIAQLVLFVIGFAITGVLVGASVPFWAMSARHLDRHGGRIVTIVGGIIALIAGIAGGAYLASQWQTVLLWLHGQPFGAADPVFHSDYSFFIFTLPVIDDFSALLWVGAILGLLLALAAAAASLLVENAPGDVPLPLEPPAGSTPRDALRVALRHAGACLIAIFVLAALGAHFGVYHLATSAHDNGLVGLDATQRNVVRPVLGGLQIVALIFGAVTLALLIRRWRIVGPGTGIAFGALLAVWLVGAGLAQGIPAGIYQATSVGPNAQQAQKPTINDFLTTSRYAWALQESGSSPDVEARTFGTPHAPTLQDLLADVGTLRNVRIQDFRQLPDTLAQIDRSRSYQTYPTITVDRYADGSGGNTEVMLGPREIAEGDIPNATFVNSALNYTHGYGVTAVSVNQVGSEGKPIVLVGQQPMHQVTAGAPPDLSFNGAANADPSIYCGLQTTQPVVSGTQQPEFDYPSGSGDHTSSGGTDEKGIAVSNPIDKLAVSLSAFGGFDLFLNNQLTNNSRVLIHRDVASRIAKLAPFLTVDGDPYVVVDPETGHLMYIADAYVKTSLFPESFQLASDATSYMRNSVKAVIDAKTCATTLYAVDLNEPITAAWNAIYPGLLIPFDQMPMYLRQHLRYPQDLFTAQSQVYSVVHVHDAAVFFNGSDRYQLSQEQLGGQQQSTQAYYIEATLPGDSSPSFVLFQTFSPGTSGSGSAANNMTAWLAAQCDYTTTNHPHLVSVRLNNGDNVLGPLQFDNNINTNPAISQQKTLLSQQGSQVILGNVIVLPFNNDSFLYVRPFYVLASSTNGTSFPQLTYVIVGTQNAVVEGTSFPAALQSLFNTTQPIPGLGPTTSPSPSPSPSPAPSPSGSPAPTPTPSPSTLSQQLSTLLNKLIADNQAAQTALHNGDYTTYGKDEAAVQSDLTQLQTLLAQPGAPGAASPSPSPSP
jgi:uncharacterized membrane protein (UPF0182 family)